LDDPKIYGAGLLSSIGEGQHCLSSEVKKLPFDLETCIATDYDVTKPQPQLFVCRDFDDLIAAVEQFSERMAFRVGGTDSLEKAVQSGDVATAEYDTGLQVSGIFTRLVKDRHGEAIYLQTTGPTALACAGKELDGHGVKRHAHGFGAPIGRTKGLQNLSGFQRGIRIDWEYENGVHVTGTLKDWITYDSHPILLTLVDCTVTFQGQLLFHPDWGEYDLAIGEKIVSVFAGAADPETYFADEKEAEPEPLAPPSMSTLDHLYQAVRDIREGGESFERLPSIARSLDDLYPDDWLLRLEILELCVERKEFADLAEKLKRHLIRLKQEKPFLRSLIENGLKLISHS
jgi:phenylalanine-4-hydroxylase